MLCILGIMQAVVLLIMPVLLIIIKNRMDRNIEMLSRLENRLVSMEIQLEELKNGRSLSGMDANRDE